jgi:hypothetical protein
MPEIPEQYQRIREHQVEAIINRHLSGLSPLSRFFFAEAYPFAKLSSIISTQIHVDRNHVHVSGDVLAFGETDIEVIAEIDSAAGETARVALLIEIKIDARQTENQGLRYRARALHRQSVGSWKDFRCVLVAPLRYLESAYPLNDFEEAGWHMLIALEDVSRALKRTVAETDDSRLIDEAVLPSNFWNRPVPEAAQFWNDVSRLQRALYPDVPLFNSSQQGAGVNVWPSFYENQLARNRNNPRRKRVQIVLSGNSHVALFIKNVKYVEFETAVRPLLTAAKQMGAPGTAWQSVRTLVLKIDPLRTVEEQLDALDCVFKAARELYEFFLENETVLLGVRTFK